MEEVPNSSRSKSGLVSPISGVGQGTNNSSKPASLKEIPEPIEYQEPGVPVDEKHVRAAEDMPAMKELFFKRTIEAITAYLEDHVQKDEPILSKTALFTIFSSAIKVNFKDFCFVGFYVVTPKKFLDGRESNEFVLEVGPYQSDILACPLIEKGSGVCGQAWKEKKTQVVNDVSKCANYIACDEVTKSEIVVPVFAKKETENQEVVAVLDIDSVLKDRFGETDIKYFEQIVSLLHCYE